jgi:hypothetical protein
MLLAFGADLNLMNKFKKTPLDISFGKYAYINRSESLVEIVAIPSSSTSETAVCSEAMLNHMDELGTFLRDCGAELGCHLLRRRQGNLEPFVDLCTSSAKEKEGDRVFAEKVMRDGDDWCTKISKMYFELETKMSTMLADVNTSLVPESQNDLDTAAALGIQIREMKLLQTAGSRVLLLDGGGMKGLVEIEILYQIMKRTGRKITDLFDWIVGTSTGAIIALGLVYGEKGEERLSWLLGVAWI